MRSSRSRHVESGTGDEGRLAEVVVIRGGALAEASGSGCEGVGTFGDAKEIESESEVVQLERPLRDASGDVSHGAIHSVERRGPLEPGSSDMSTE